MKRYINFFLAALLFSGTVILASCGGEVDEEEEEIIPEDELITTETEIKLDLAIGDIPSPTKLTSEISKSGASYDRSLMNSTSKLGGYSTNYQKGINLGVYIADLSYAGSYSQTQDATSYMGAAKQLADNLGISAAIDESLFKKFEKHMSKPDSLVTIIDAVYDNAGKYLRSNERVSTASLVLAGGWIEGLYISTHIIADTERNEENESLYKNIGEQKFSLKNLLELLNQYAEDPDHVKLIEALGTIDDVYKNVPAPSKIVLVQVQAIAEKVKAVRDAVTN